MMFGKDNSHHEGTKHTKGLIIDIPNFVLFASIVVIKELSLNITVSSQRISPRYPT